MALTPELEWVLRRAFVSSADAENVAESIGLDRNQTVALARRLGVAARIGSRGGAAALAGESRVAAVAQMRAREAAVEVAQTAATSGIACCFLKGTALELRGALAGGERSIGDVDVLVAREHARELVDALMSRGFVANLGEEYAHHLPALAHPSLGMVEVHTELPGVVVGETPHFAGLDDLARADLLERCGELTGEAFVPRPSALLAHLLAHALVQHGFRPEAYPPLRLIGDLIDLGVADGSDRARATCDAALELVATSLPREEARGAIEAARALACGDLSILEAPSPAGTVLRHLLAATLDDDYRATLKLQELAHPLHAGSPWRGRLALLWTSLALSRRQIDAIYGPPRRPLGYLGRRLWRPFDLVGRAWRAWTAR